MSTDQTTPVLVSAVRTPIGRFLGGLSPLAAPRLGARVIKEAVRRAGVEAAARLGHALLLSGKPRDAIKVLAEAMEFPGEHHRKSLMLQAHSERMRGRAQRAKELIERAAALPGGDRDA